MEGQLQVDLPHAGALGEMSVGLRNYWDVWLTIADAGVPWAAVGGCLRLGQPSFQCGCKRISSQAEPFHGTAYYTAAASDRGHAAHIDAPEARGLWISMTMLSGGWNIPRAHVIAEGSLCLSLVMQLFLAITLCSIPVLAISDDENSMHGDWAITLSRLHRMARASMP